MLREMVRAAYNHPSVILWSLGNECKVAHPEAPAFFAGLAEAIRGARHYAAAELRLALRHDGAGG